MLDPEVCQVVIDAGFAVAAVGGHCPWCLPGAFLHPFHGGLQAGCVGGVAGLDVVIEDDPVGVVADLGFGSELDRLAKSAFRDRAGVGVVQADSAGRAVGGGPADPLPGLRGDLAGRVQQVGQVVDRPGQPATPPPAPTPQAGPAADPAGEPGSPDTLLWVGVAGLLLGLLAMSLVARSARRRQHPPP